MLNPALSMRSLVGSFIKICPVHNPSTWKVGLQAPKVKGAGAGTGPSGSVLVFGRCKQDQFHAVVPFDIGVVARRDLKEITGCNLCVRPGIEHADDEGAGDTITGVVHWT